MIDIGRIEMVNDKIHQYLKPTRLDKSQYLGANVFLKFECEQPAVRSFKIRGVLGKLLMLTEEETSLNRFISSGKLKNLLNLVLAR